MKTALLFLSFLSVAVMAEEPRGVWWHPELQDASAWDAKASSSGDALFVKVNTAPGVVTDLLLKQPLAVPDAATNFSFLCGNDAENCGLRVHALVRDADGHDFIYYLTSNPSWEKGVFFPEHANRRLCEERFSCPAFARPVLRGGNAESLDGKAYAVKRPLVLRGLRVVGESGKGVELFFRDFAFTRLTAAGSKLYYLFRGEQFFGELDLLPYITPAHVGKWYGRRFEISWEVRDNYAGAPFVAGERVFSFGNFDRHSDGEGSPPYTLRASEHISLPVTERGTYWVKVKTRLFFDAKKSVPDEIIAKEYRLDVINGGEPSIHPSLPPEVLAGLGYAKMLPQGVARFNKPAIDVAKIKLKATALLAGVPVKTIERVPQWSADGKDGIAFDLSALEPGAYEFKAEMLADGKLFDSDAMLWGKAAPAAVAGPIPAAAPSWKDLAERKTPMFHLDPMRPDGVPFNSAKAWEECFKPFLDQAGTISHELELSMPWSSIEPLPGVYDFHAADRFVDYAAAKGFTVLIRPEFRDPPEWLPGCFERDAKGELVGHNMYLFHGVRPNYTTAAPIRDSVMRFANALATHYRSNPAVQGYHILFEHPGDAPYNGWYEGRSVETVAAFRDHCRQKWPDLAELNRRWGTAFSSFSAIVPPDNSDNARRRLDWLQFRTTKVEDFLKGFVSALRQVDDRRLVIAFTDGVQDLQWFMDHGCISANGGLFNTMGAPAIASFTLAGFQQRVEDHHPGNWTAFPTQLDSAAFTMTLGGGASTHCKAFVATKNKFADANDPNFSLGRYKRFMPIWTELRQTVLAQPIEAFSLTDRAGSLLRNNSTFGGYDDPWGTMCVMQAQVPFAGMDWKRPGKLLLVASMFDTLEQSTIDKIVAFVENGGTLFLFAESGRRCVETPATDWVLLRRLGFAPPLGEAAIGKKATAVNRQGAFTLRDLYAVPPQPAGVDSAATFADGGPAISWKRLGKGQVAVCWAQTIIPPALSPKDANTPFLRDIAVRAGIKPIATPGDQRLWTNLLKTPDNKKFYCMAVHPEWHGVPGEPVDCKVRWAGVPDGKYRATELCANRDLGVVEGSAIRDEGLDVKLQLREAAIIRLERLDASK